jgi:hypothetical protein
LPFPRAVAVFPKDDDLDAEAKVGANLYICSKLYAVPISPTRGGIR